MVLPLGSCIEVKMEEDVELLIRGTQINTHANMEFLQPVSRRYWKSLERHKWMVALFLGCACLYTSRTIMPITSVQIGRELNWDKKQTGTALGAFFWGYMLTQVLGGHLADSYGGEKVVTLAAYGWASLTLLFPFIPAVSDSPQIVFLVFLIARVLVGFCQGFHFPSLGSLMSHRVCCKERQFTFCFLSSGSHFGTLLCGSFGSVLMENFGWRTPFIAIGLLGLVWTTIIRYLLVGESERVIAYSFEGNSTTKMTTRDPIPWGILLRSSAFWAMLAGHLVHTNSFFILLSWLPSYFHDNFPDARSWVFNVVPWLITIPTILFSGMMADKLLLSGMPTTRLRKLMTTVSLLGTAFFLFLMAFVTEYYSALTCMALAVCSCGFHNSGILLNPQDLAPEHGGAVFGIMNMVGAVPGFLGVYIAGYILEVTKSWPFVFTQTAVLCVLGWILYVIFGTGRKIV